MVLQAQHLVALELLELVGRQILELQRDTAEAVAARAPSQSVRHQHSTSAPQTPQLFQEEAQEQLWEG
jgi:hypothetical protein